MRIALVYRSFHLTGSLARTTVELAGHLSSRHDVHVFSIGARTERSLAPNCTFHDVTVNHLGDGVHFSARELFAFGRRAARMVDREQFEIVHVCNPSTWIGDVLHLPGVARGEADLQGMTSFRFLATTLRHPGNAARRIIEHRAIRNEALRRIHVDAPSVVADLGRYHHIHEDRILLTLPAVNLAEFRPATDLQAARAWVSIHDPSRTVLLFCGNDFVRKGLDRAIDAVAATDVDVELLVIGSCPEESRFQSLATARGVSHRVRFLGSRPDVARFYRAADILLLPTRADVWGITPIEAMASGIPSIVSSAAGSAAEVRRADSGIVLSEPFAVHDLRRAIDRLAMDPALRREMGQRGLVAARAHSWSRRGQLIEEDLVQVAEVRRRK